MRVGNDYCCTLHCDAKEEFGKLQWQTNTAMRVGITGQIDPPVTPAASAFTSGGSNGASSIRAAPAAANWSSRRFAPAALTSGRAASTHPAGEDARRSERL